LRGKFHQHAGRYEEALADLRKALELRPGSPSICNHLAWLYATGPEKIRDARAAVALAERAVELQPGEWSYRDTLGLAYYRAGRIEDAMAALEKSLAGNSPADQTLDLYFLAMCHCRLGDANKAKEYVDRAMAAHEHYATSRTKEEAEELGRFRAEAQTLLAEKRRQ
jgi:tetratricopeptide (TPR) repeat protein